MACELDPAARQAVQAEVSALQRTLGECSRDVRWVSAVKWHITLAFLGALPRTVADAVRNGLSVPVAQEPFVVSVGGVGVFPQSGRPRVVWVGVQDAGGRLARLHEEIRERLSRAGFVDPDNRPFHPHVTVGRITSSRRSIGEAIAAARSMSATPSGRSAVDHVTLFDSRVVDRGSLYDPVLQTSLCWTPTSS